MVDRSPRTTTPAQTRRSDAGEAVRLMAIKIAVFMVLPLVVAVGIVLWVGV